MDTQIPLQEKDIQFDYLFSKVGWSNMKTELKWKRQQTFLVSWHWQDITKVMFGNINL